MKVFIKSYEVRRCGNTREEVLKRYAFRRYVILKTSMSCALYLNCSVFESLNIILLLFVEFSPNYCQILVIL